MKVNVTLQISLAPSDYRHSRHMLKHQLQTWSGQVDEVLLTYDTHRSKGRFALNWEENHRLMSQFLEEIAREFPTVLLTNIDYSQSTRQAVARMFFSGCNIPPKDFRGGPFYTYFYGMYAASHNYVFHIDSDLFFGGCSSAWMAEAVALMESHEDVLFCSPLPGPPRPDGQLTGQPEARAFQHTSPAFAFGGMSTRLFLVNRKRLAKYPLKAERPPMRAMMKAWVEGNAPYDLPENVLTRMMQEQQLIRVDFLGAQPGMWSLHPPYRTDNFYVALPQLIERVVRNQVPPDQLGYYDMTDSMCDWSEARQKLKANRWWKRVFR